MISRSMQLLCRGLGAFYIQAFCIVRHSTSNSIYFSFTRWRKHLLEKSKSKYNINVFYIISKQFFSFLAIFKHSFIVFRPIGLLGKQALLLQFNNNLINLPFIIDMHDGFNKLLPVQNGGQSTIVLRYLNTNVTAKNWNSSASNYYFQQAWTT